MSDSVLGLITWALVMLYAVPIAFITGAAPLVGAILGLAAVAVIFWLMAVKGKAAS